MPNALKRGWIMLPKFVRKYGFDPESSGPLRRVKGPNFDPKKRCDLYDGLGKSAWAVEEDYAKWFFGVDV